MTGKRRLVWDEDGKQSYAEPLPGLAPKGCCSLNRSQALQPGRQPAKRQHCIRAAVEELPHVMPDLHGSTQVAPVGQLGPQAQPAAQRRQHRNPSAAAAGSSKQHDRRSSFASQGHVVQTARTTQQHPAGEPTLANGMTHVLERAVYQHEHRRQQRRHRQMQRQQQRQRQQAEAGMGQQQKQIADAQENALVTRQQQQQQQEAAGGQQQAVAADMIRADGQQEGGADDNQQQGRGDDNQHADEEQEQQQQQQEQEQQQQQGEDEGDEGVEEEVEVEAEAGQEARPPRRRIRAPRPRVPKPECWQSLAHQGVLFKPDYKPHGVQLVYDGHQLTLGPEAEEAISLWVGCTKPQDAARLATMEANFLADLRKLPGAGVIESLELCNFDAIRDHLHKEAERHKALTQEEQQAGRARKEQDEAKYKTALWDGKEEPVGNFRVVGPCIFSGMGNHPKAGCIKPRIYPRDITINIGEGEAVPAHPFPGQQWKEVCHDKTGRWLVRWRDPINSGYKYVYLAAHSTLRGSSDMDKYEKARQLGGIIADIRSEYWQGWYSEELQQQQMGVALYLIDTLSLRAGHEKDEGQTDTVGCCSLKVANVTLVAPSSIRLSFLGKDSIEYSNTAEVEPKVYALVEDFMSSDRNGNAKDGSSDLFDALKVDQLNRWLTARLDKLTARVFRTYNASSMFERELRALEKEQTDKEVECGGPQLREMYLEANRRVAVLCNHQRTVSAQDADKLQRLHAKRGDLQQHGQLLVHDLDIMSREEAGTRHYLDTPLRLECLIAENKEKLAVKQLQIDHTESSKGVSLTTSRNHYIDPRIMVAWCKRNDVQCELVWDAGLMKKFNWAVDINEDFQFDAQPAYEA